MLGAKGHSSSGAFNFISHENIVLRVVFSGGKLGLCSVFELLARAMVRSLATHVFRKKLLEVKRVGGIIARILYFTDTVA